MYGIDKGQLKDLENQCNTEFFKKAKLAKKLYAVSDDFRTLIPGVKYILISIPSKYIAPTLEQHRHLIKQDVVLINSSKGLEHITGKNYFDIIHKILPKNKVCSIAGPSYAIEVFHKQHTFVNVICRDLKTAKQVGELFNNHYFRTKAIIDEIGASISSAMKNGLAVCCGMLYGLNISINTIAAVITRGIQEISNFSLAHGGELSTSFEYCAIGDIYLTCSDEKSRNFELGMLMAKIGVKKAIKENTYTVEGLDIIRDIYPQIKKKSEYILFNLLYELVSEKISPKAFIEKL